MAYYGSLGDIDVGAISKSVSDTATEVFVYDTRKDSDGGAWRKRTQHTSWYNETLNTATRGARKEFPAVAVIVATTSSVTIYDGDDPDMPMWMIFNAGSDAGMSSTLMLQQPGYSRVVCMLNGILVTGTGNEGSNYGQPIINFISEKVLRMDSQSNEGGIWLGNIADRDSSKGYASSNEDYVIASSQVNDVAMTVLPNAPIDPSTGLPVPTVAVATASGVSVIRDDGTVINVGGTITTKISINEKGIVYYASTANGGYYGYSLVGGSLDSFFNTTGNLRILSNVNSNTNNNLVVPNAFNLYSGQTVGLTIVNKDFLNTYNDYNGIVAYATTSYNTGWMHGDIKGAFLSDTSTASVTGTELITNGTFSTSDLSAWTTIVGGTAVITGGLLKLTDTSNAFVYASAPFSTVVGKKYVVTFDIVNNGDNTANYNYVRIGNSHNSTEHHDTNYGPSYGKYQVTITASATTTYITLINGLTNGLFGYWDNVFARIAEPDRSVNNKGLAVYGTITKTAVASGANLVDYTNSSNTSNYLVLPLSTSIIDLTANFSVIWWFKCNGTGYNGWSIVEDNISSQSSYSKTVLNWFVQAESTMGYRGSSITSPGDFSYPPNAWNCMVITKSSIGIQMYINGILIVTTSGTCVNPAASYSLRLFQWSFGTAFYGNATLQMSLFRLSQSVPSPSQILKIYNDEKMLFQENSQATLYGASDAVTALAYDDTTNLLSVGTSSGRSDFSGLKRINNTTTAVTTAISASNGLIAEQ